MHSASPKTTARRISPPRRPIVFLIAQITKHQLKRILLAKQPSKNSRNRPSLRTIPSPVSGDAIVSSTIFRYGRLLGAAGLPFALRAHCTTFASLGSMRSFPSQLLTRTMSPSSIRSIPANHSGIGILTHGPSVSEMPRERAATSAPPFSNGIISVSFPFTFNTGPCNDISSIYASSFPFFLQNRPKPQKIPSGAKARVNLLGAWAMPEVTVNFPSRACAIAAKSRSRNDKSTATTLLFLWIETT
jgi:hypothetical protein